MMGAQQMKPYDERLIERMDKQQNLPLRIISSDIGSQQDNSCLKSVMLSSGISSTVFSPRQCITVANFAKIKKEITCTSDDRSEDDVPGSSIKNKDLCIPHKPDKLTVAEDTSVAVIQESFGEFDYISLPSIELKPELLATQAEESNKTFVQNEVDQDSQFVQHNVLDKPKNMSNNILQESEFGNDISVRNIKPNSTKLVKNPLAFLKKTCDKDRDQVKCLNATIKSEPIVIDEELESTTRIKAESDLQTNNLNELLIKSEDPFISETEETLKNTNLYQTCLSYNLDSSLDVNLSQADTTDLDEVSSKQLPEDVISVISSNTTPQSIQYFSAFEISSEEDKVIPLQSSRLTKITKTRKKPKPHKRNANKEYKPRKKRDLQSKQVKSRLQVKRIAKPKTKKYPLKKYYDKDSAFKVYLAKRNLPKTAVKTRKNTRNLNPKAEFPKPLKLEAEISQKDQSGTVELPKPITFKSEFPTSGKHKHPYLRPELQPLVRLKRLSSEELLRTKYARRTRTFKGNSETRRDFLIQKAYSLNPSVKFNRLSMEDTDQTFCTDQCLLGSRYATSCSLLTDMQNDDTESKYFSPQERYSFFQSSTPDASSMFSGPIDNGVSTSTPSTSHHNSYNCNKYLLLQIAAERAFINNHLMHFGHSPMQFDLYNNLNELTIFLKFVFGNMNLN